MARRPSGRAAVPLRALKGPPQRTARVATITASQRRGAGGGGGGDLPQASAVQGAGGPIGSATNFEASTPPSVDATPAATPVAKPAGEPERTLGRAFELRRRRAQFRLRAYFVGASATQSVHRPLSVGAQLAGISVEPAMPSHKLLKLFGRVQQSLITREPS